MYDELLMQKNPSTLNNYKFSENTDILLNLTRCDVKFSTSNESYAYINYKIPQCHDDKSKNVACYYVKKDMLPDIKPADP